MALNRKFNATKDLFGDLGTLTPSVSESEIKVEEINTKESVPHNNDVVTREKKEEVVKEINVSDKSDKKNELPSVKEHPEVITNPDLTPSELELVGCGTTLPKSVIRFLQRRALQQEMSAQGLLAEIIKDHYEHEKLLDDETIDKIIDDYNSKMKTNERKSFMLPRYLKDYLNEKTKEYGIKINVLLFYYINEYQKQD